MQSAHAATPVIESIEHWSLYRLTPYARIARTHSEQLAKTQRRALLIADHAIASNSGWNEDYSTSNSRTSTTSASTSI